MQKSWSRRNLTQHQARLSATEWLFEGREEQLPPRGDWHGWMIIGGRGSGKTRAGAEWVSAMVRGLPGFALGETGHIALIGETLADVRDVMVEGPSGILAVSKRSRPRFEVSRRRVLWDNGAVAMLFSSEDPESLRGPQFDAAWADEVGCPATDKGSNQPNVFGDPKSSENALPYFSAGTRDDLQQRRYIEAIHAAFDPSHPDFYGARNPVSTLYQGPMVSPDRIYLWAYDARPFPVFPLRSDVWSDGDNWRLGHWLNGRLGGASIDNIISAVARDYGIEMLEVEQFHGWLSGYLVGAPVSLREALEPLLTIFGGDVSETKDGIRIISSDVFVGPIVTPNVLARSETGPDLTTVRSADLAVPDEALLSYVDPLRDYLSATARVFKPSGNLTRQQRLSAPIAVDEETAGFLLQRWFDKAQKDSDAVQFSMPSQNLDLATGVIIDLKNFGRNRYRIERIEDGEMRRIEARRVEPATTYASNRIIELPRTINNITSVGRPFALAFDNPVLIGAPGSEVPRVSVAAFSKPWRRQAIVRQGQSIAAGLVETPATMGQLMTVLPSAPSSRWLPWQSMDIVLTSGALETAFKTDVLSGQNRAALLAVDGAIEIVQFCEAVEIAPNLWRLSQLLRGLENTDIRARQDWQAGAQFVLLDKAVQSVETELDFTAEFNSKVGPASKPITDTAFIELNGATAFAALLPPRPAHLRADKKSNDFYFSWVRRGRYDADSWEREDIPLGEQTEQYRIDIQTISGVSKRVESTSNSSWVYSAALFQSDFSMSEPFKVQVWQVGRLAGYAMKAEIVIEI